MGSERTLLKLGVSFEGASTTSLTSDLNPDHHIVFLDADQPDQSYAAARPGANLPAAPVIGIVGVEAAKPA